MDYWTGDPKSLWWRRDVGGSSVNTRTTRDLTEREGVNRRFETGVNTLVKGHNFIETNFKRSPKVRDRFGHTNHNKGPTLLFCFDVPLH